MSSHSVFRAACVQMRSGMTPAANIDQAAALVREAAGLGASYVQTPEMSNAVCRDRDTLFANLALEEADPMLAAFRELARELRIHLHAGSLAILRPDGKVANRAFLIGPEGGVTARYDKIHLYDVDLPNGESWRESRTYTGGDRAVVADLPHILIRLPTPWKNNQAHELIGMPGGMRSGLGQVVHCQGGHGGGADGQ